MKVTNVFTTHRNEGQHTHTHTHTCPPHLCLGAKICKMKPRHKESEDNVRVCCVTIRERERERERDSLVYIMISGSKLSDI